MEHCRLAAVPSLISPHAKGETPGDFVDTINAGYPDVVKTALIRGDCLFNYRRHSYDEIKLMVLQHAKAGVNVLLNFHGLNDTRMQASVARAANEVRAETGLDIVARGTICIEDNPNITVQSGMKAAEELIVNGHQGFYLKSASGRLKPEFVGELVEALAKKYPEQSLDIHAHDTYGEAMPSYLAAIEAATKHNHSIGVDVLHPAIAGQYRPALRSENAGSH
jgi:pyruvate/oxaloacetate carboxyltransferase